MTRQSRHDEKGKDAYHARHACKVWVSASHYHDCPWATLRRAQTCFHHCSAHGRLPAGTPAFLGAHSAPSEVFSAHWSSQAQATSRVALREHVGVDPRGIPLRTLRGNLLCERKYEAPSGYGGD